MGSKTKVSRLLYVNRNNYFRLLESLKPTSRSCFYDNAYINDICRFFGGFFSIQDYTLTHQLLLSVHTSICVLRKKIHKKSNKLFIHLHPFFSNSLSPPPLRVCWILDSEMFLCYIDFCLHFSASSSYGLDSNVFSLFYFSEHNQLLLCFFFH